MKRFTAMLLAIVMLMALSVSALADTSEVAPGKTKFKSYDISSSPSYDVSITGATGDKMTIVLSLNDLEDPNPDGTPNWKKSATKILVVGGTSSATIKPTSDFYFVSGRSDRARLSFVAASGNSGTVEVTYPD